VRKVFGCGRGRGPAELSLLSYEKGGNNGPQSKRTKPAPTGRAPPTRAEGDFLNQISGPLKLRVARFERGCHKSSGRKARIHGPFTMRRKPVAGEFTSRGLVLAEKLRRLSLRLRVGYSALPSGSRNQSFTIHAPRRENEGNEKEQRGRSPPESISR